MTTSRRSFRAPPRHQSAAHLEGEPPAPEPPTISTLPPMTSGHYPLEAPPRKSRALLDSKRHPKPTAKPRQGQAPEDLQGRSILKCRSGLGPLRGSSVRKQRTPSLAQQSWPAWRRSYCQPDGEQQMSGFTTRLRPCLPPSISTLRCESRPLLHADRKSTRLNSSH